MIGGRVHSGRLIRDHFQLLLRVSGTELRSRYAGSLFGLGWALLTPLLMLGVYAAVYALIFRVRVPGLSTAEYVLYIFAGLVPYLMTADAIGSSVTSVIASRSVWTNTVFPVDLAPPKAVLLSQVPMTAGLTVILGGLAAIGKLQWTIVLLPVVWGLHVLAVLGVTWILALVNLVFRDLQNAIGVLLMILMIASPIAYTPDMVPPELRFLLVANPYYPFLTGYQQVTVLGELPSVGTFAAMLAIGGGLFAIGGYFFSRAKGVMLDYV
jgi:lipopolysaccharide transport system permease protein